MYIHMYIVLYSVEYTSLYIYRRRDQNQVKIMHSSIHVYMDIKKILNMHLCVKLPFLYVITIVNCCPSTVLAEHLTIHFF